MGKHVHKFERYILLASAQVIERDRLGIPVRWADTKVFTDAPASAFHASFVGWECRCGEQGYAVPA